MIERVLVGIFAAVVLIAAALIVFASLVQRPISLTGLVIAGMLVLFLVILVLARSPWHIRVTRSPREPTPLDQVPDLSRPAISRRAARGLAIAVGVGCYALAIVTWVSGGGEPSRWLSRVVHQWSGDAGLALFYAGLGTVLILVGAKRH